MKQVHEIFGADVSGRTGRERAAAEAAEARIEPPHAEVDPRDGICECQPPRVVEMKTELELVTRAFAYGANTPIDASSAATAATASGAIGPSNAQPNAVDTSTLTGRPAVAATSTIERSCSTASAVDMRTLR